MPKSGNENVIDVSNLEFVAYNDTATFMNGTVKYNKPFKSPWKLELELFKYDRGEWILQLKKTFADLCPDLHNPLSPAYFFTKHMPKCPIAAGVRRMIK